MSKAFAFGLMLAAAAIILLILEAAVRFNNEDVKGLISAYTLFSTLTPNAVVKLRSLIPQDIWFPFFKILFDIPAWLLVGFPGLVVSWRCRPKPDREITAIEHDMYLYDRLVAQAKDFDEVAYQKEIQELANSLPDEQSPTVDPARTEQSEDNG